jgi:GAF domain-containing protein
MSETSAQHREGAELMTSGDPARRVGDATELFDQLSALLDRFEPLETVLSRLVHSATATIPEVGSATVSILRGEQARTAAASHQWAADLDEHQYNELDGPCLEAARTGRLVRVETTDANRWPTYCRAARDQQVGVAVGAPLLIDEDIAHTWAALNLTAPSAQAFDPLDEALLELFTHALSTAINHTYRHQQAHELVDRLGHALDHRDVIGQAKGLLMARHRCSPEKAFEHLRNASQRANVKLHEVAARLVASESGLPRD